MSNPVPLQFLDKVGFTHILTRQSWDGRRQWRPFELTWEPKVGYVVGVRTLKDGTWQTEIEHEYLDGRLLSSYEVSCFVADRYIRAYLIATNMQRKPVLVLPEHLTRLD